MSIKLKINKKILQMAFLLGMLAFSYVSVAAVKSAFPQLISSDNKAGTSKSQNIATANNNVAQNLDLKPVYRGTVTESSDDTQGQVLPASTSVGSATCGGIEVNMNLICPKTATSSISSKGGSLSGQRVSKNAKIEIYKITYPRGLFSGTAYLNDADPNDYAKDPLNCKYTYAPSQGQQYRTSGPDGRAEGTKFSVPKNETDITAKARTDSLIHAKVISEGSEVKDEMTGKQGIFGQNGYGTSPAAPNTLWSLSTGLMAPKSTAYQKKLACEQIDVDSIPYASDATTSCTNLVSFVDIVKMFDMSMLEFNNCEKNDEDCKEETIITGLQIDAAIGSNTSLSKDNGGMGYAKMSVAVSQAPGSSERYKIDGYEGNADRAFTEPYRQKTKCQLKVIEFLSVKIIDVPCIWELPHKDEYYRSTVEKSPYETSTECDKNKAKCTTVNFDAYMNCVNKQVDKLWN